MSLRKEMEAATCLRALLMLVGLLVGHFVPDKSVQRAKHDVSYMDQETLERELVCN
jgi:hypothetical protein